MHDAKDNFSLVDVIVFVDSNFAQVWRYDKYNGTYHTQGRHRG